MHRSIFPAFMGLFAVSILTGCTTERHRWQTEVNEDGSLTRTISQPSVAAPGEAEATGDWDTRRFHAEMDRNVWPERITEKRIRSALPEYKKELDYVIEQGTFESLAEVPPHYRYELSGTDLVSELRHELLINDYGLVKEYVWTEVVTDIVVYEEIPAARREMIRLLAAVVEDGLTNSLGEDYDISALLDWIKAEGDQLVEETTLLLLSKEVRTLKEDERQKRFEVLFARYGITEMSDEGLQVFLRTRIRQGVKRKDGKPLDPELIEALIDNTNGEGEDGENLNKYQEALRAAWVKHMGDEEDGQYKFNELLAKQCGVHSVPMAGSPQEFDVWLKLPGKTIESNGTIDEEGFLKWSFGKEDIWPTGYQMTARSVLPVRVRNSPVLRKEKLGSSQEMLQFLRLVQVDDELHRAVQGCLEQNSLRPLKDLEALRHSEAGKPAAQQQLTTEEQAKWRRARQLLDLLNQEPPAVAN